MPSAVGRVSAPTRREPLLSWISETKITCRARQTVVEDVEDLGTFTSFYKFFHDAVIVFSGAIRGPKIVDQELAVDMGEEQPERIDPFVIHGI